MRHLEIRDLWLQKEVADGKLFVEKIAGDQNPADLMTKILTVKEVVDRLKWVNIDTELSENVELKTPMETQGEEHIEGLPQGMEMGE